MEQTIPDYILQRIPLMKTEWLGMLNRLGEHAHAPRWNICCGDHLTTSDISFIKQVEEETAARRKPGYKNPDERLLNRLAALKTHSLWFGEKVKSNFYDIPFMQRSDMQSNLALLVPLTESLARLIINPTSGTTGHPILAPNHPKAIGCYDAFIRFALQQHGVHVRYDHNCVAALQLCAQDKTITYYTVHSYLQGAGFAKLNLKPADSLPKEWPQKESPRIYIDSMQPVFLSGDPFAFYHALSLGLTHKPRALLSCALVLDNRLRKKLESAFGCPVVDFYSLNETGPIGYSCPQHPEYFHQLPTDIFLEVVDAQGLPCTENVTGEIVITGGRNPYLPLLRYKTGDRGSLNYAPCSCGDPMPRLKLMDARKLVLFYTPDYKVINPIDISRILRRYPVTSFQVLQARDFDCRVTIQPGFDFSCYHAQAIEREIKELFNDGINVRVDRIGKSDPVEPKPATFSSDIPPTYF
jgi:phenylacetate-CoA ligase